MAIRAALESVRKFRGETILAALLFHPHGATGTL